MISIPVAIKNEYFRWQLDLFWYYHKKHYGVLAHKHAHAIIVEDLCHAKSNSASTAIDWSLDIPKTFCTHHKDFYKSPKCDIWYEPLNIPAGLEQIIKRFDDEDILELLDCDMFHVRKAPVIKVEHYTLLVETFYEPWHLHSLGKSKYLIDDILLFNNKASYYNGGFVPIIGTAKTFKVLLSLWPIYHLRILESLPVGDIRGWWAGMYSLQAACEILRINMVSFNRCAFPPHREIMDHHYIAHYSVDQDFFNKKKFESVNPAKFPKTPYYSMISEWLLDWKSRGN